MHDDPRTADDAADALWLAAVKTGDDDAFIALYRRRRDDVYRFAFAMAKSRTFAQDATQEVFLRVLEHAARYEAHKGPVRAWLLGLARHVVLDRLRAERRLRFEAFDEAAPCENEQSVLKQQRLATLHEAIAQLPLEYRDVLVLCELHELSYVQCAHALDCPIGTVRSRLHRARAQLTAMLREPEAAPPPSTRAEPPLKASEVWP
jgi:RNA polymerase sigma-70 factor (ECF subfamily)